MNRKDYINICIDVAIDFGFKDPENAFWQCNRYSQAVFKVAKILKIKGIKMFVVDAQWQIDSGDVKKGQWFTHVFLKVGNQNIDFTHRQIKNDTEFPFIFGKMPSYFKNKKEIFTEIAGEEDYVQAIIKRVMQEEGYL